MAEELRPGQFVPEMGLYQHRSDLCLRYVSCSFNLVVDRLGTNIPRFRRKYLTGDH